MATNVKRTIRGRFMPIEGQFSSWTNNWSSGISLVVLDTASEAVWDSGYRVWCWWGKTCPLIGQLFMMTSSDGNIFRVTGPLCGEFTGSGEFPAQRPVRHSFDVFFDLLPNKRLSKQPWGWWFETPSWSLWRQCNVANRRQMWWWLP